MKKPKSKRPRSMTIVATAELSNATGGGDILGTLTQKIISIINSISL